ncbi:Ctr copper transporter [Leucogyrophana mollusca]|uniref:Ctr copper transporter n=1 Tax=Leucogyrophana mollusca TaxID=85980 RepID=A0ACB8B152_9AGAM|nr:Ctr copper transporter [Leucogyrophana mollusca]
MDHGGHGGHDMGPMCSMNMLWNTQIIDTCIVFKQWHIHSNSAFVLSFFVIVGLGVLYEYLRAFRVAFDGRIAATLNKGKSRSPARSGRSTPDHTSDVEEAGLLTGRRALRPSRTGTRVPPLYRVMRAVLYGATVFLSFFLMLVFMTYNAYLILAVVAGAAIGHYVFGGYVDFDGTSGGGKGMACH